MSGIALELPQGMKIRGPIRPGYEEILTPDALKFLADLHRAFDGRRRTLLRMRVDSQAAFDAGQLPSFPKATADIREGDWTIAPMPADIQDRRVEITGPVDRKMIINALNSGAKVFMADFEDSSTPTWDNNLSGQINLRDANLGTISLEAPGKTYRLNERTAVLFVRPRGLHLPEAHVLVDGEVMSGSLFDFGLYLFHNAATRLAKGTAPYFYLPKLEHYLEARWWNDVFVAAQEALGIPRGTIKATVLIETLPASFLVEEILWELREHSAGLNCGRWDYIFSYIKTLRAHAAYVVPDRHAVGMTQPALKAYTTRVIQICHRRKAMAMGGMAAQIPIKDDPAANEAALAKVKADKLREVTDGHDGTWVAHPALVPIAMAIFDEHMKTPNQIERPIPTTVVTEADLLTPPQGPITESGVRANVRVGIQYLEAWLGGSGCVPLYWLMEDAATAEISRTQVWQWIRHGAHLDDGRKVTVELFRTIVEDEMGKLRAQLGQRFADGHFALAISIFDELVTAADLTAFLTLPAYDHVTTFTNDQE